MTMIKTIKPADDKAARPEDTLPAAANLDGEIREFVRRDVVATRKPNEAAEGGANINLMIERVAGSSIKEIDNLIDELQIVRDFLRNEGERVQREITSYAQASHAAMASAKVISDSMGQWKNAVGAIRTERR